MWLIKLFITSYYIVFIYGRPFENKIPPVEAFNFMKKFGYLEAGTTDSEAIYTQEAVEDAIKNVQKFGALPQTGQLDNATLQLMSAKRCGVPDIVRPTEPHRWKRYIIASPGWNKRNITYFVANWTPKIGEEDVNKYMQMALDTWGRYGRLTFTRTRDQNADIIVAFGRGYHGDRYPFDGPGNILAHAFFPYEFGYLGGDIHFDDDENWMVNPKEEDEAVDFFTVAVHELGHSLGLGHSPVPDSIMFPYYKGFSNEFALGYDDILAMYQLYITRPLKGDELITEEPTTEATSESTRTPPTNEPSEDPEDTNDASTRTPPTDEVGSGDASTEDNFVAYSSTVTYEGDYETVEEHLTHDPKSSFTTTTMKTIPDICEGNFDAVAMLRGELFFFKDEYLWRLQTKGIIREGYPVFFRQMFPFPESVTKIDAAYERLTDGHIILFTGNQYWDYDGDKFVNGSPRPLTDYGLPTWLDQIDAAQIWEKNGKTYMYRNELFWRYNETTRRMDEGYPHHIERRWRGVPRDLDAATTWTDGFTYFFKGQLYWRFDNQLIKTDDRYPHPAAQSWLGCPEKPDTLWWLPPEK